MAFAEDLSVLFDLQGFAVSASRTPAAGGAATVGSVIVDIGEVVADGVVIEGPSLSVPVSTWSTLAVGDTFVVNAVTYKARSVVLQGDGAIARVQLVRV